MRRRRPRRRGFSLFELLLVVALIGLVLAALAAGLGRASEAAARRQVMRELTDFVALARIDAMRRAVPTEVVVRLAAGDLEASRPGSARAWRARGLTPARAAAADALELHPVSPGPDAPLKAVFASDGGTRERRWTFDATGAGGRIWIIAFDPISGAPSLVAETDADDRSTP